MLKESGRRGIAASALFFSVAVLVIAVSAGCSSSSDDNPVGPGPTPAQNYVSGAGALQVTGKPTTMVVNISGTSKVARPATAVLLVGVNGRILMGGTFNPEGGNQVVLSDAGQTYSFIGQVTDGTLSGTFSDGVNQQQIALAVTTVPTGALIVLGPWDFTHSVTIETAAKGVDACPVPEQQRTITEACADRYQVGIEGNELPATACAGDCLPNLELTDGTLNGTKMTIFIPEVNEPTTPEGRLFSLGLAGCNVIFTGAVEIDFDAETIKLVNLDSQCDTVSECDLYCADGKLNPDCLVNYSLTFTQCTGDGCACPT